MYFLPSFCISGAAAKLPIKAPRGGIEPIEIWNWNHFFFNNEKCIFLLAHETIFLFGSKSGSSSRIDGIPGAEYPRTIPIHKYETDTHSDRTT